MRIRAGVLVCVVSVFILGFQNSAVGQFFNLLYQKNGGADLDVLGWSVASAGDVNGDGAADFIIGAFGADPSGVGDAGSAYVYSGSDGSLLFQKDGAAVLDGFGWSVASAGDVNGDGKPDFIVGAPSTDPGGRADAGSAYVYSGLDGSLLFQKDGAFANDGLGSSVASAGDVNGDGKADFIVGAPYANPGGRADAGSAYVYSGLDGSLLFQKDGALANDELGYSVASAGDANGDGKADFIIGAPNADPGGFGDAGSAYLYSGADGSLLYQKDGADNIGHLGWSVASAGDADGDGRADFMLGAPSASPGGLSGAGSVYVYSGATGTLLHQKDGASAGDELGYSVASAGDADADGRDDFIAGAIGADPEGRTFAGSVFVYSGATGALLVQKNGAAVADELGHCVASAGDVNGDGKADFIIGTPNADPEGLTAAGSAYIYASCAAAKGDMNGIGGLTPADAVAMLNCVYLATGSCDLCFADVNCSGDLTPADVVVELNRVYLAAPPPC